MRSSHIYLCGVAAATVAFVALAPANSQDPIMPDPMTPDVMMPDVQSPMTPEQKAERVRWPADRQAAYDALPEDAQTYYWSLPPERQEIFWRLRDDDRVAITRMNGDRQEASWEAIELRMANPPSDG